MNLNRRYAIAAALGLAVTGAFTPMALASPPAGISGSILVTAVLDDEVSLSSDGVTFRTDDETDIRMQNLVFAKGAVTGWHHHPGMVLVAVASGAVTVWDRHCRPTTYGPGQAAGSAFTESGDKALQVTSKDGASVYATYVAPQATPLSVFRLENNPPRCATAAH